MKENELNKFRTVVSEVSSFVGNPVERKRGTKKLSQKKFFESVRKSQKMFSANFKIKRSQKFQFGWGC